MSKYDYTVTIEDVTLFIKKVNRFNFKVFVVPKKAPMFTFTIGTEALKIIFDLVTYMLDSIN